MTQTSPASPASGDEVDPSIRPIAFGLVDLLFDLTFFVRELYGDDLDCAQIMICVNDATMRAFMESLPSDSEVLRMRAPPEEMRGSISRRMIAEKTGIARETVRRKVGMLIEAGLLAADEKDGVRIVPQLHDPRTQKLLEAGHAAVGRYMAVVRNYGID